MSKKPKNIYCLHSHLAENVFVYIVCGFIEGRSTNLVIKMIQESFGKKVSRQTINKYQNMIGDYIWERFGAVFFNGTLEVAEILKFPELYYESVFKDFDWNSASDNDRQECLKWLYDKELLDIFLAPHQAKLGIPEKGRKAYLAKALYLQLCINLYKDLKLRILNERTEAENFLVFIKEKHTISKIIFDEMSWESVIESAKLNLLLHLAALPIGSEIPQPCDFNISMEISNEDLERERRPSSS